MSACSTRTASASRSAWRRRTATGWPGWPGGWSCARGASGCAAVIESMNGARFVHDTLEQLRLGGADRRRAEGQGAGAVGVQDRPDRRAGAGRAVAPRSGAGDLAARPSSCARARAGALSAASGQAPLDAQEPHPRDADHLRAPAARSPICSARRPRAARRAWSSPSRGARNVDASLELIDDLDREIAAIDARAQALGADHRYIPLLMTVPGDRLGPRLHDRRRDRRHRPLRLTDQAVRLHRPVPARLPVRRHRPPRPAHQARPQLPALGADRGRACTPASTPALPRALPAHQAPPRPPARRQGRPDRPRPQASPRRSGTCSPATSPSLRQAPLFVWPPDGPPEMRHRSELPSNLVLPPRPRAIET